MVSCFNFVLFWLIDKKELPLREVGANLNEEFRNCSSWTDACSKILMDNITSTTLFLYDRFEYFLGDHLKNPS